MDVQEAELRLAVAERDLEWAVHACGRAAKEGWDATWLETAASYARDALVQTDMVVRVELGGGFTE